MMLSLTYDIVDIRSEIVVMTAVYLPTHVSAFFCVMDVSVYRLEFFEYIVEYVQDIFVD